MSKNLHHFPDRKTHGRVGKAWIVRLAIIVVVAFNMACAVYVGSFLSSSMNHGHAKHRKRLIDTTFDATKEIVDNVDRQLSSKKGHDPIQPKKAKKKAPPAPGKDMALLLANAPPMMHSLVPPTKPVPLIRGANTQYSLMMSGGAAVLRERMLKAKQPPKPVGIKPKRPAGQCSPTTKCINIVYTPLEEEYEGLLASMLSVLHKAKNPENICFHIIIPVNVDGGRLCRLVSEYRRINPDHFCTTRSEKVLETQAMCSVHEAYQFHDFQPQLGHWVGACTCGTNHVEIIHLDPQQYDFFHQANQEAEEEEERTRANTTAHERPAPGGSTEGGLMNETRDSQNEEEGEGKGEGKDEDREEDEREEEDQEAEEERQALLPPSAGSRSHLSRVRELALACLDDTLLPHLSGSTKVVFLQPDTLVQADIKPLASVTFKEDKLISPAKNCDKVNTDVFNFESVMVNAVLDKHECLVSLGVFTVDLERYQAFGIQKRVRDLVVRHSVRPMWSQGGVLAALILALQGHVQRVESFWDVTRLGMNPDLDNKELDHANILHWTGPRKPWLPDGLYRNRWSKYKFTIPPFIPSQPSPPPPPFAQIFENHTAITSLSKIECQPKRKKSGSSWFRHQQVPETNEC